MTGQEQVHEGMPVYGPGNELLGTVTDMRDDGFDLSDRGRYVPLGAVARVARGRVYVRGPVDQYQMDTAVGRGAAMAGARIDRDEVVVPVVEERLDVEKRPVELGEATIDKNMTEERREVPVELRREEVDVERAGAARTPDAATAAPLVGATAPTPDTAAGTPASLRGQVKEGLDVIGSDNTVVGKVKELRADDFL
ncbi:MAG TPA: DUF2382 domain-containing protein, partial [Thermomicrobiales bacterium]|nr:DUF2382 domain-containing protein [Thermomicrobiales bacterium]